MQKSSFFNAVNHDRKYKAEDWANYFKSFVGNGVFPAPSVGLQIVPSENMVVTMKSGKAFINGYMYENTDDLTVTLANADGVLTRIDRVVIRWDLTNRSIVAAVKSSVPSASPAAPTLQRDSDIYELCVAEIAVNAGATTISAANITDTRFDNALCGIVGWLVNNVDTTALFAQFTAAFQARINAMDSQQVTQSAQFNAWFAELVDVLDENTAGNLLNLIRQNAFDTFVHTKAGTNHELTLTGGHGNIKFIATDDFDMGDTFTLNGQSVIAETPNGNELPDSYFVAGSVVIGFRAGAKIIFMSGASTVGRSATLSVAGWANGNQIVSVSGITASNNIIVGLAENATADQFKAASKAQLMATAQADSSVTITAYGKIPSIALPITIFVLG